jgi:hypothetical protein
MSFGPLNFEAKSRTLNFSEKQNNKFPFWELQGFLKIRKNREDRSSSILHNKIIQFIIFSLLLNMIREKSKIILVFCLY